eukprot:Lithocolla_globosa_v1_NODE_9880_length_659_cov_10.205298.p1 type:complete len:118 gc:universal NODE_9880_length_659_cov_10.205298:385-32(-)
MVSHDGTKALSTWIQATQIYRLQQKREGKPGRIPKKDTPEYAEILKIQKMLSSGEAHVDPDVIKTRSKPMITTKMLRKQHRGEVTSDRVVGPSGTSGKKSTDRKGELSEKVCSNQTK